MRRQRAATSYEEWLTAQEEIEEQARMHEEFFERDHEFFEQITQRRETYERLQQQGDEWGLMFHLRSELMRRHAGGAGYNRDGSTWLRKHTVARERIAAYQQAVCSALRYIASGEAPGSGKLAQRLAFINETRHAYGRTALLLSGGAAFGVKHLGVIAALLREQLLPRIVCGTSAGSIVAAAVCVRDDNELHQLVEDRDVVSLMQNLKFFGLRRGASRLDLAKSSASFLGGSFNTSKGMGPQPDPIEGYDGPSPVDWTLQRGRSYMKTTNNLLDGSVLQQTIMELIGGDVTFLEAFDRTGRVLNITVTRSDGKAPPLLCNYLTTPQLLVYSASLASCAIPGVFEAVELMCKGRDGHKEPYFKTGGWRWTDGGLQADLPKERLSELFNVNQFIVSQVNPVAPLFVPVGGTGLPWLEELNVFLKHQLVGFIQGVSKLGQGKLFRPGGFRGIDMILQEYEGTVTIRPHWQLSELRDFLANFDARRVKQYMDDGEKAAWPQIPLIRSLCEVEFCLDEVAAEMQRSARQANAERRGSAVTRGKLPSYVNLEVYEGKGAPPSEPPSASGSFSRGAGGGAGGQGVGPGFAGLRLPGVASRASLCTLVGLDADDHGEMIEGDGAAAGMAPWQA